MSEERLVAEIPVELKEIVDADPRTNKEIVQAALWREMGGERMAALERRIEEKENRINMIEREKNERERELEEQRQELEALKTKVESEETQKESAIQDAIAHFADREFVEYRELSEQIAVDDKNLTWFAEQAGIEPQELKAILVEEL